MLCGVEHDKSFITSEPDLSRYWVAPLSAPNPSYIINFNQNFNAKCQNFNTKRDYNDKMSMMTQMTL